MASVLAYVLAYLHGKLALFQRKTKKKGKEKEKGNGIVLSSCGLLPSLERLRGPILAP